MFIDTVKVKLLLGKYNDGYDILCVLWFGWYMSKVMHQVM